MSDIGVEVGQKMRSAIKAKLTELDCYVDDELPDYIMVMIANKRTRSQMKEDLQLFLSSKTSTFVEWLHIVLKKLKEVHVTNPDVFKKPVKRKSSDLVISEDDLKKIKKEKKEEAKALKKARKEAKASKELQKSLTDDLPITANKLSEARKIVVMKENQMAQTTAAGTNIDEDSFDIPLLSEISASNEEELEMIEKKIKNVKSRLGLHVESDEDEDCLNIKADPDDLLINEQLKKTKDISQSNISERKIIIEEPYIYKPISNNNTIEEPDETPKRSVHTRITFDKEKDSLKAKYAAILNKSSDDNSNKRKSVLDRLGKRSSDFKAVVADKRIKSNTDKSDDFIEEEKFRNDRIKSVLKIKEKKDDNKGAKIREGILSRLGVMSKVSIPPRRPKSPDIELDEEEERKMNLKEVPSVVKLKPRMLPPKAKQANPNLLFKAVAEAQRSVTQTPAVGAATSPENNKVNNHLDNTALFTKKYKEKMETKFIRKAKLLEAEKRKLKILLNNTVNDNNEVEENVEYEEEEDNVEVTQSNINQKFIVTLDGIEKTKFTSTNEEHRSIVKTRRVPSPIVFESPKPIKNPIVPEKLPVIHPVPALKKKERCKYWPGCRQGDKCEFYHPSTPCKMFPNCKFEDKCLYIHPTCKFESSCTRRDCPYSHTGKSLPRVPSTASSGPIQKSVSQICKYFPNCSNIHCTFYHPRLCKFGVFCKNQSECNFVHSFPSKPGNLTWRSDHK